MPKGKGIKNSNVQYKDMNIMLARFGATEETETNNLYDSKRKIIAVVRDEEVTDVVRALKSCETDLEVCMYLKKVGAIDNYFSGIDDAFMNLYIATDDDSIICENCLRLIKYIPSRSKVKIVNEDERIFHIGGMLAFVKNPEDDLGEIDDDDIDEEEVNQKTLISLPEED